MAGLQSSLSVRSVLHIYYHGRLSADVCLGGLRETPFFDDGVSRLIPWPWLLLEAANARAERGFACSCSIGRADSRPCLYKGETVLDEHCYFLAALVSCSTFFPLFSSRILEADMEVVCSQIDPDVSVAVKTNFA